MTEDEPTLIARAQKDPRAFAPLYERYVDKIYAYAQREVQNAVLAQDIVAATFEKALKNLPRYQWRGTNFGAWLYRIARNEIMMHYRQRHWLSPLFDRFPSSVRVEQRFMDREAHDQVAAALRLLSEKDQELLRLRYYEDLSNIEIAEVMQQSPNATAVAIHRALKRLRDRLQENNLEAVNHVRP